MLGVILPKKLVFSNDTFQVTQPPAHGILTTNTLPLVVYTPSADYFGSDSFFFVVNNGSTNSAPALVAISVSAVNDAPSFVKGGIGRSPSNSRALVSVCQGLTDLACSLIACPTRRRGTADAKRWWRAVLHPTLTPELPHA